MKKNFIFTAIACCALLCMFPEVVEAVEQNANIPFGGAALNTHADNISKILFGPVAKIAAVFGGAAGLLTGFIQQSVTKILTFGGLLLASVGLPTFINSFYTMLIS